MYPIKRLHHKFRVWAGLHPMVFYSIFWFKKTNRPLMICRNSEIVIEGFPRSANTFSVIAFQQCQSRDVRVAHHLHVPAQVIRATQWSIPTVVLVRNPLDAITSLLVRYPYVEPRRVLQEYVRFYRRIFPLRDHFVVAEFGEVVSDYGAVIRRVNQRFATSFTPFVHTAENVDEVFKGIKRVHVALAETSNQIAMPSPGKEPLKKEVNRKLNDPSLECLIREAVDWYQRYIALSSER